MARIAKNWKRKFQAGWRGTKKPSMTDLLTALAKTKSDSANKRWRNSGSLKTTSRPPRIAMNAATQSPKHDNALFQAAVCA